MEEWFSLFLNGAPAETPLSALNGDSRVPADFKPIYEREILPQLADFEDQRIGALITIRWRMMMAIPASALIAVAAFLLMPHLSSVDKHQSDSLKVAGFLIFCLWGWVFLAKAQYVRSIKTSIFPSIFRYFGPQFRYDQAGRVRMEELAQYGIIPSFSSQTLSDYVLGSYKEVALEIEQAQLENGSGKNRTVVFKGLIVRLGVNKNFKGQTLIRRDHGKIGNWFSKSRTLQPVRLEDPTFEARYEVFSSDQIEARYLLTTSFMERLMALENLLGSELQASFTDRQLLILLPSDKNWFEPGSIFESATFVDDINVILEQMKILFQIIEVLKLDEKTGL